ncbi:tetratricopeptide repeat protein, partial [Streptomyces prasinus]|uniref:tetratricopeptide repeat protein n=1 Tax=Streptomyces prasinus TaxID=67345 RepID=UPI0037D68BFC
MGGKNKAKGRNKKSGGHGQRGAARPGTGTRQGNSFAGSRFDRAAALGSGTQYNMFVHEYAPAPSALASLPELPAEFTGRNEDLAFLLDILDPGSGIERPAVVMAGMGGVGKTTLAHAAGHASLKQKWFTGVLLVDLRGYDLQPAQAEQALDSLLRLLGVPSEHIPPTGPEREVLYRSHLAERAREGERLLVVADNASSTIQVKPLLPPAPHGMIVTSRKALPGVGRPRSLHQLQPEDAVVLLNLALREADPSDQRVEEDKEAAERIVVACGCLPLALQIVAAQLIQDPGQPLAERAQRIASGEGRLDSINDGERDLRTVFDQTLNSLLPQQQDLFRMLSLNAGPDISTAAAAALTHQTETVTDNQLSQLAATHLIERSPVRGRWQMHDLLRDYAHEKSRAHCQDNRTARRKYEQSRQRLTDYYIRLAENADTHIASSGQGKPSPAFYGRDEALTQMDAECANLVATAHAEAPSESTARLGFALRDYLEWRHRPQDLLAIGALVLDTCRALGDPRNEPGAWHNLGSALDGLHRYEEALTAYRTARTLAEQANDKEGQGAAWNGIGNTLYSLHRYEEALTTYRTARTFAEQTNKKYGQTGTWNNIGNALDKLHRYDEALAAYDTARTLAEQINNKDSQAAAWNHTGNALESLHRYDEAFTAYRTARTLAEQINNKDSQAAAWNNTGNALESLHRYDEAFTAYCTARTLAEQTNNKDSQAIAWNNTGSALGKLHRYDEAFTAYDTARTLAEQTSHTASQGTTWNGIGNVLYSLHRYGEALTAYDTARTLTEEIGDTDGQAAAWNNTGSALEKLHRYGEALTAYDTARTLAEQANNKDSQAIAWNNTGNALEGLHRYGEALTAYCTARTLAEQANNKDSQAIAWNNTGSALEKLHRYGEALTAYDTARTLAEQA